MREAVSVEGAAFEVEIARTSKYSWTVRGTLFGTVVEVSAANKKSVVTRWRRQVENIVKNGAEKSD
jgi:hypothetical protein